MAIRVVQFKFGAGDRQEPEEHIYQDATRWTVRAQGEYETSIATVRILKDDDTPVAEFKHWDHVEVI